MRHRTANEAFEWLWTVRAAPMVLALDWLVTGAAPLTGKGLLPIMSLTGLATITWSSNMHTGQDILTF